MIFISEEKPYGYFGPQPVQPGESNAKLAGFGLGVGIVAGSGFVPYKGGRLWDKYIAGARAIESAFPSAILRTFRVSESLSPLESYKKINITPDAFKYSGKYGELFKSTFGPGIDRVSLTSEGVFGTITGKGNKAIGEGIQILAGTQKGLSVADFYARVKGLDLKLEGVGFSSVTESLNDSLLRAKYHEYRKGIINKLVEDRSAVEIIPSYSQWIEKLSPTEKQQRLILSAPYREAINIAGKEIQIPQQYRKSLARAEVTSTFLRAKAATTAARLNTLLKQPVELPIVGETIGKLPFVKHLPVKPGTAGQMLGRYVGKGIAIGAAWKGLEYIDYLRAEGNQAQASISSTLGGAALGSFLFQKAGQRFSGKGAIAGAILGLTASVAPRFEKGIIPGVASMYSDAQITRAKISETLGVSDALRKQDEIAPDLNSLGSAVGFGGVGALTLGVADYFAFLTSGIDKTLKDKTQAAWAIFDKERLARKTRLADKIWDSTLGQKAARTKIGKSLSKIKSPMGIGFLGGLAAWGAINAITGLLSGNPIGAIPGAGIIGTTETPEELEAIYSGEKEVAIKKGRFWEFGRSSKYSGGQINYFRKHNVARLQARAYQKGLYGEESERWEHDPLLHPLKALFGDDEWKYHYEQKYQYERGQPLSSTYGEDIPFIGPAIAATFGKLIKPRKAIRPDEWSLGDNTYAPEKDLRDEQIPAYELGGVGRGAPVSPEDTTQILNRLNYKRREAVGLVGFAEASLQKAITGREESFQNLQTLGTMGKETGSESWLWKHLNLGGGLATTEPVRRFVPRTPSYLETYNPLENKIAKWMPKDYFMPLNWETVPEAEIRLPGKGYEALNPEVKGLAPDEYPLIHRLKILGDVAMWSDEYKETLAIARNTRLSKQHQMMLNTIVDQVRQKKVRKEFSNYRFNEDLLNSQKVTVTQVLSPREILTEEYGEVPVSLQGIGPVGDTQEATEYLRDRLEGSQITIQTPSLQSKAYGSSGKLRAVGMLGENDIGQVLEEKGYAQKAELKDEFAQIRFSPMERMAGKFAETAMHGIDTPIESLTPFSPASKFIRKRSAIEEYVKSEAISTSAAFWDKPLQNFIAPTINTAAYQLGLADIPESVKQKREMNEYYDMLKWVKGKMLGDEEMASSTVFGADVFSKPPRSVLPRSERDYFGEFSAAQTEEERAQILNLVPENERRVYISQWMRQEESAAKAKVRAKIDNDYDNQVLATTKMLRRSEGFAYTSDLEKQWLEETGGEIPYDDWIRNKKAEEYFSTHSLPGADWIGFNPACDIDDIKLKDIQMRGLNPPEFDLWGDRERALVQKPYISEEAILQMQAEADYDKLSRTFLNAHSLGKILGDKYSNVQMSKINANIGERYDITIKDKREKMVNEAYRNLGA